jgi:hypothetical protein
MLYPRVGALDLRYEKLELPGTGQMLITYHADRARTPNGVFGASPHWRRRSGPAEHGCSFGVPRYARERRRTRQVKVWYKNRHPFLVTLPHRRIGR